MTTVASPKKKASHRIRRSFIAVAAGGVVIMALGVLLDAFSNRLEVTEYRIATAKVTAPVRMVVIADLHGCRYGDNQQELVTAIQDAKPNAILYAGDVLDDKMEHTYTRSLFEALGDDYPSYYVAGNHELWDRRSPAYREIAEGYGIEVLSGDAALLEVNGQRVQIAGVEDPEVGRAAFAAQLEAVAGKVQPGLFTLLLSHRPEKRSSYQPLGVDLVLSGHAHGGQWRLPKLLEQGLLAPNQGLFPKYTSGLTLEGDTYYLISRGLAKESTPIIPRVFNRPELVVVVLEPIAFNLNTAE